jgi:hypothetical protein
MFNYFFSPATVVAQTHLNITLYVHCLPFSAILKSSDGLWTHRAYSKRTGDFFTVGKAIVA